MSLFDTVDLRAPTSQTIHVKPVLPDVANYTRDALSGRNGWSGCHSRHPGERKKGIQIFFADLSASHA